MGVHFSKYGCSKREGSATVAAISLRSVRQVEARAVQCSE